MKQVEQEIVESFCKLPLFLAAFAEGFEPVAPEKLNLTEGRTLINIYMQPDEPMAVYSMRAGLTRGAFTSVADSLEKKGLIQRKPMKGDRRVVCLALTDCGLAAAVALDNEFRDFINQKISHLEPARILALRDAMQVLIDTVSLL